MQLILKDGKTINNLTKNGNNYVSKALVDVKLFANGNSDKVIEVADDGTRVEYKNLILTQQVKYSDGYYFCFHTIPQSEKDITDIQLAIAEVYEMIATPKV